MCTGKKANQDDRGWDTGGRGGADRRVPEAVLPGGQPCQRGSSRTETGRAVGSRVLQCPCKGGLVTSEELGKPGCGLR